MKFVYKATNNEGNIVDGTREAADPLALSRDLRAQGLTLITAERQGAKASLNMEITALSRVTATNKILFGRNLAIMLKAGLSLSRALAVMEKQTKNPKFKKIVAEINGHIKGGNSLSSALERFPSTFNQLFIAMVRSGEESGKLAEALTIVSSQLKKTNELKKRVLGAMLYPAIILTAMVLVGMFMLTTVVPTLAEVFLAMGIDLPASTRFIITISTILKNHYIPIFIIAVITIILIFLGFKTKTGRRIRDFILLRIPLIAPLVREINSARTTRTLSSLLGSGVAYVQALRIVKEVVQNDFYEAVLAKAEKNIQVGMPISSVFSATSLYPTLVGEMIAVGEETGKLSEMLMEVATYYEDEVDQKTKNMSTIIEPFLMLLVGVAVGFFALSMITPMYALVDVI